MRSSTSRSRRGFRKEDRVRKIVGRQAATGLGRCKFRMGAASNREVG